MRTITTVWATAALAGVLVLDTAVWAAPPSKCEFSKLKSGVAPPVLTARALARRRQEEYPPAVWSFWN